MHKFALHLHLRSFLTRGSVPDPDSRYKLALCARHMNPHFYKEFYAYVKESVRKWKFIRSKDMKLGPKCKIFGWLRSSKIIDDVHHSIQRIGLLL